MEIGFATLALVCFGAAALITAYVVQISYVERHQVNRTLRAMRRYDVAVPDARAQQLSSSLLSRLVVPSLAHFGRLTQRLLPASATDHLRKLILQAGNPPGWEAERVLAARVAAAPLAGVGLLALLRAGGTSGPRSIFLAAFAGAVGFYAPERLLREKSRKRQAEIRKALPDTLDLLAITVEAGLSFDAALTRIASRAQGPLSEELNRILHEVQLGRTRSDALRDFGERSDLPEVKSFALAMIQADSFGVSVGRTLKVQASEMRMKRRQRAEEAAQKIPVKITIPLVLCILPTLFIMLLGPAAINVYQTLFGN